MSEEPGTLFVVPTPIGNLEDITMRGLRILREASFIAAEDTRHTRKLLTHFDIHPVEVFSYHRHNLKTAGEKMRKLLEGGRSGALVSDAGMPGVSDPGEELIRELHEAGIRVEVLPGPSAFVTALVGSGLPVRRSVFVGFLPVGKKERRREWERIANFPGTLVFYEAPHRLRATLAEMRGQLGDRRIVVVKELSKLHEMYVNGHLDEYEKIVEATQERGEYVIVVEGARELAEDRECEPDAEALIQQVNDYIEQGMSQKEALKEAAKTRRVSRRVVYRAMLDAKDQ